MKKTKSYYPIQIPHILGRKFAESINYSEEIVPDFRDFNICIWEMQPISDVARTVENIIVADGCIDLVIDYKNKWIGFSGMSKTNFNFRINMPNYFLGARFKSGAFHSITNIHADKVMDNILPINAFDKYFNIETFFSLSFSEAKMFIKDYIGKLIREKMPNNFITLIDQLNENIPHSVSEICEKLNYSERQCQRLFAKNYGLTPQMVLSILRFQNCLKNMTTGDLTPQNVMNMSNYYDQSHFINDFKRNIGLTPFELIQKYKS